MIKRRALPTSKILIIVVILVVAAVIGLNFNGNGTAIKKATSVEYPEYLNLSSNYVFTVPKSFNVDDQAIPGAQLVYTGAPSARTLEEIYNANGISVQAINDLTDHSSKAFKDYVNKTFVPGAKKDLSTNDLKVSFAKAGSLDSANIVVRKDGKQTRFIYLQSGLHPVRVISKTETDATKKIEQTIVDVEASDLKDQTDAIKQSIQTVGQLLKDQKGHDLFLAAASELQSKTTEADLTNALKASAQYTGTAISVSGISYTGSEFSVAMRFTPAGDNQQPTFGALAYKKVNGQWKLEQISLPSPKKT